MTAFDTDILSDIAKNNLAVIARVRAVPVAQQYVPIVAAEEAVRGQLATVRRAQASGKQQSLEQAYAYLQETLTAFRGFQFLPYTRVAHSLFTAWQSAKVRIGTQDLRIAAICLAHGAKLVTRNARDYGQVPGLILEVWN
jgi:tRNA(fMet)-specific endonuclease VapC